MFLQLLIWGHLTQAEEHHHHHHHHHHGAETLPSATSAQEESIYGVPGQWEDAKGKTFQLKDLSNKTHLFVMLYTKCESACPILVEDVRSIVKSLPPESQKIPVILFSIDAEGETLESLNLFSKKRNLFPEWIVARASARDIATLASVLGVNYKRLPDGEYIHSNSIFLVNQAGSLVAQQDGLNKMDPAFVQAVEKELSSTLSTQGFWGKFKRFFKK